jgi:ubiquinone/menaquinone biosynthesis C-methylase UbiE
MKKTAGKLLPILFLAVISIPFQGQQSHDHKHEQQRIDRHRDRWYWQMPNRLMNEIGVKEGMVVADIGAGDGYFTFWLSERVGKEGRVYANDIDDDALQVIRDRCNKDEIKNITAILGKEDDPLLPGKSIDLALMVNVIHYVKNSTMFLKNLKHSLKPGGTLVIVQWDAEKMDPEMPDWEPENRALFTQQTILRQIYKADYEVIQIKTFLPMQNIYICQPTCL